VCDCVVKLEGFWRRKTLISCFCQLLEKPKRNLLGGKAVFQNELSRNSKKNFLTRFLAVSDKAFF
jgi:hypothetical protein